MSMTEETWKRLEYYAKCCESGKREYILMGKVDFKAAFSELTRSRAEVEGLRQWIREDYEYPGINMRRAELACMTIAGTLSSEEQSELDRLEAWVDAYLEKRWPRPVEYGGEVEQLAESL